MHQASKAKIEGFLIRKNASEKSLDKENESSVVVPVVSPIRQNSKLSRCTSNYVRMAGNAGIIETSRPDPVIDLESSRLDPSIDLESRDEIFTDDRTESTDYVTFDEEYEVRPKSYISRARHMEERGPLLLQIVTFFGGVGMVLSSMADFQLCWQVKGAIDVDFVMISIYTWMFGLFIMGLEGRSVLLDIRSLHTIVSNYMKVFRFVWGRGLFLLFAGSLQFSLGTDLSAVYGAFVMSLGAILFSCGMIFKTVVQIRIEAVPRDSEVDRQFDFFDTDRDGFLTLEQFRDFAINLVLQNFEELDYDAEFPKIDADSDGKVSLSEVKIWIDAVHYREDRIMATFEKVSDYIV